MSRVQASLQWLSQVTGLMQAANLPVRPAVSENEDYGLQHPALFAYAGAVVAARLMHADGEINRRESDIFVRLFTMASVSESQLRTLLHAALKDNAPLEQYLHQLADFCRYQPALKRQTLLRLARIAMVDGPLELNEYDFLAMAGGKLGLSESEIPALLSEAEGPSIGDAHRMLRVKPDADVETIRRAYRDRIRYCHPDRWQKSEVYKEFGQLMQRKSTAINLAYHALMQKSGAAEQERHPDA